MNKFLIYTSNLGFTPKDMEDIVNFAKGTPKFRISSVELNQSLANVEAGDNIITTRGNSLYVIKAFDKSLEDLSVEDRDYVDRVTRYGLKKANITGVESIVKFSTWCKSAKPLIKKVEKMKSSSSMGGMLESLKSRLMPTKAEGVRIAQDGNICVETSEGFVSIGKDNSLTVYPKEFTADLPVFTICKPIAQLQVGDVIAKGRSYAKVTGIKGDVINGIGYTGNGRIMHIAKDFLFNQTMVRVVISMVGNLGGGQINPLMLMAMSEDSDDKMSNLLPLMMMSQQNGSVGMNPMLMLAMADKGDDSKSSIKDLLMMSALSGGNFGNLFGGATAAPAATAANQTVDDAEELKPDEDNK